MYEKKIVAFVDILGFSQFVVSNERNPLDIKELLDIFQNECKVAREKNLDKTIFNKEITTFSDCIVISYAFTNYGSLFHILLDLFYIQVDFICKGFFLRGGVTCGDVYHNGDMIFGPAMVRAYEIESQKAVYPRILVSPELVEDAIKNPADSNNSKEEAEYLKLFLDEIEEGYYELTHFQSSEFDSSEEADYFYLKMKELINNGVNNNCESIKAKYVWLKNKYIKED